MIITDVRFSLGSIVNLIAYLLHLFDWFHIPWPFAWLVTCYNGSIDLTISYPLFCQDNTSSVTVYLSWALTDMNIFGTWLVVLVPRELTAKDSIMIFNFDIKPAYIHRVRVQSFYSIYLPHFSFNIAIILPAQTAYFWKILNLLMWFPAQRYIKVIFSPLLSQQPESDILFPMWIWKASIFKKTTFWTPRTRPN